ncbi:MAG TPA: replication-relaxation family protein [Thermoanaerobaculia bacterium]
MPITLSGRRPFLVRVRLSFRTLGRLVRNRAKLFAAAFGPVPQQQTGSPQSAPPLVNEPFGFAVPLEPEPPAPSTTQHERTSVGESRTTPTCESPPNGNIQAPATADPPHADAVPPTLPVEPGLDTSLPGQTTASQQEEATHDTPDPGEQPRTDRDRAAVLRIVRLRVLSYDQLWRSVFSGHPSKVGRRMQQLERSGWVSIYKDRTAIGGKPQYAFPTRKAFLWARGELLRTVRGTDAEKVVQGMLPNVRSRLAPHVATRGTMPFLAHQILVNEVALTIEHSPEYNLRWVSTWPRPFPHTFRGLALPQPDLVAITAAGSAPRLIFAELDRSANESLAHFVEHKAQRTLALEASGLLRDLTGFDQTLTLVVVAEATDAISRIEKLMEATSAAGAGSLFAFTVAEWLHEDPAGGIWFSGSVRPSGRQKEKSHHEGLRTFDELLAGRTKL